MGLPVGVEPDLRVAADRVGANALVPGALDDDFLGRVRARVSSVHEYLLDDSVRALCFATVVVNVVLHDTGVVSPQVGLGSLRLEGEAVQRCPVVFLKRINISMKS